MKQFLWNSTAAIFLAFFLTVGLSVVPKPLSENCFTVKGIITKVASPCCQDVVLWLEGDQRDFYINRGVEAGIDVDAWDKMLRGQFVELQVIRTNWSPLNPGNRLAPVAQIKLKDGTVFDVVMHS